MAVSPYFDNYGDVDEQRLIDELFAESIHIYGNDVYYCPRSIVSKDDIYGEDQLSEYNGSYLVEMYIKSVDGFEGDGIFLSKFGLEIRDQVTFTVAISTFDDEIGIHENITRPREGDLVLLSINPDRPQLFVIRYVNDRSIFYQLGGIRAYDLVCEAFEYSSERFNTGIEYIDNIQKDYSVDLSHWAMMTEDGYLITDQSGNDIALVDFNFDEQMGDYYADNDEIQEEAADILNWTEIDPFSEGNL